MTEALKNYIYSDDAMRKLFFALAALCVAVFMLYGYFLREAIVNVVEREKTESEMRTLLSRVGDLESRYMSLKNTVDLARAEKEGFKTVATPRYISRAPTATALSLRK